MRRPRPPAPRPVSSPRVAVVSPSSVRIRGLVTGVPATQACPSTLCFWAFPQAPSCLVPLRTTSGKHWQSVFSTRRRSSGWRRRGRQPPGSREFTRQLGDLASASSASATRVYTTSWNNPQHDVFRHLIARELPRIAVYSVFMDMDRNTPTPQCVVFCPPPSTCLAMLALPQGRFQRSLRKCV